MLPRQRRTFGVASVADVEPRTFGVLAHGAELDKVLPRTEQEERRHCGASRCPCQVCSACGTCRELLVPYTHASALDHHGIFELELCVFVDARQVEDVLGSGAVRSEHVRVRHRFEADWTARRLRGHFQRLQSVPMYIYGEASSPEGHGW